MEWSVWLLRVYTNTHSTSLLGFIVIGMVVKLASWLVKSYDFTSQHRYTMWNQVENSKSSKLGQNRLNSGNSGTEFTEFDKINKNYWPTLLSPLLSIPFVSQKLPFPLSLFPKSHILWFSKINAFYSLSFSQKIIPLEIVTCSKSMTQHLAILSTILAHGNPNTQSCARLLERVSVVLIRDFILLLLLSLIFWFNFNSLWFGLIWLQVKEMKGICVWKLNHVRFATLSFQ